MPNQSCKNLKHQIPLQGPKNPDVTKNKQTNIWPILGNSNPVVIEAPVNSAIQV